jgi:hypothetical protein
LGGNVGLSIYDDLAVLRIKGTEVLHLLRTPKGVAISAKTFGDDGKIVAEIVDNRYYVNPDDFFRIERPDQSSLVVYDRADRKVLDIRYINSHSVKVAGIFRVPGAPPFIADGDHASFGPIVMSGSCLSGTPMFSYQ